LEIAMASKLASSGPSAKSVYREGLRAKHGWRGKIGVFPDSIRLNRLLFWPPKDHGPPVAGMMMFWLADAFACGRRWPGAASA
jgi:hypothetical protein